MGIRSSRKGTLLRERVAESTDGRVAKSSMILYLNALRAIRVLFCEFDGLKYRWEKKCKKNELFESVNINSVVFTIGKVKKRNH